MTSNLEVQRTMLTKFIAEKEKEIARLEAQYRGARSSWVSTDISMAMGSIRHAKVKLEELDMAPTIEAGEG